MPKHLTMLFCLFALLALSAPAARADDGPPKPGVSLKVFHLSKPYERLPTMVEGQLPNFHEIRPTIDYPDRRAFGNRQRFFVAHVDGILRVAKAGEYTFRLISDDGSKLWLDGELVIDHDGVHGKEPKDGTVTLDAGDRVLKLRMFQGRNDTALRLEWKTPGADGFELVPADVLFTTVGDNLATSGGNKSVVIRGIREIRPGAGEPLQAPNPAFTLEPARPDNFKPSVGAMAFLPDGKLAITTFTPQNNGVFRENFNGSLYIVENPTEKDPAKIRVRLVSEDDLHDPLGMAWHDGALYICDRNEVSKWTDTNGDEIPDKKESFASGWISDNYHHFTFGLPYHDGHFYIALSTNITFSKMIKEENIKGPVHALNGPNPPERGGLLKINAETGDYTVVAGGLRTPNGVSLGPDGVILCPDNQGAWKPASGIYAAEQGAFYGHYNNTEATSDFYPDGGTPSAFSDQPISPPAVWLPQNEISNSPAELIAIPDGQPHAGQFLMAEITLGGLKRIFLEKVDGTWQGAAFRHSHGFESGLNRLAWGPDGCLYIGGMGSGGNWGWRNKRYGLMRLRPTGETAFEFSKVEATAGGFRVSFTKPVAKADLEELSAWAIDAWAYEPTRDYGGPKKNRHVANPTRAVAAADGLSVELTVPGRKPDHVYHIRTDPMSKDGETMWSPEAWVTFHKAPAR